MANVSVQLSIRGCLAGVPIRHTGYAKSPYDEGMLGPIVVLDKLVTDALSVRQLVKRIHEYVYTTCLPSLATKSRSYGNS